MAYDAMIHETPETEMDRMAASCAHVMLEVLRASLARVRADGLRDLAVERYGFWLGAAAEDCA